MRIQVLTSAAVLALALPIAAHAQSGVAAGATTGAVVGGITDSARPKFREYVVREHHPSYRYSGDVVVGTTLPETGVTYYEVPQEYGVKEYRYTIVNDRTVLVDPRTHRIVEIIS